LTKATRHFQLTRNCSRTAYPEVSHISLTLNHNQVTRNSLNSSQTGYPELFPREKYREAEYYKPLTLDSSQIGYPEVTSDLPWTVHKWLTREG